MFESAEIGHTVSRKEYKRREPLLRTDLLAAQYELLTQGKTPVVILVNGVDGAGKGETVNLLNEWMDPRHIRTEVFSDFLDGDQGRPEMWQFWKALPPKGHIGVFFGSWYTAPILAQVMGHDKKARFAQRLERIRQFERMLVAEGAIVLKWWFHLSKAASQSRFKALQANPLTAWRVTPLDWEHLKHYDGFIKVCEKALRKTSTGEAPWLVIDGSDPSYRALTAGQNLLDAMQARLAGQLPQVPAPVPFAAPPLDGKRLLDTFDYTRSLKPKAYEKHSAAMREWPGAHWSSSLKAWMPLAKAARSGALRMLWMPVITA